MSGAHTSGSARSGLQREQSSGCFHLKDLEVTKSPVCGSRLGISELLKKKSLKCKSGDEAPGWWATVWEPSDKRSAGAPKAALEDGLKSSCAFLFYLFFSLWYPGEEKKTSQMALLTFGLKTFVVVVVTVSIDAVWNQEKKKQKCSDGSVLDEAASLQSKCSAPAFLEVHI